MPALAEATLARYIPLLITAGLAILIVGATLNINKLIAPKIKSEFDLFCRGNVHHY